LLALLDTHSQAQQNFIGIWEVSVDKKWYSFLAALALLSLLLVNAFPAAGASALSPKKYALDIQLNMNPVIHRYWMWQIEHMALPSFWDLYEGYPGLTRFVVTIKQENPAIRTYVGASPVITNPDPRHPAILQEIAADFAGSPVDLSCGIRYPYVLKPGESINCTIPYQRYGRGVIFTVQARAVGVVSSSQASAPVIYDVYTDANRPVRVSVPGVGEWTFSESGSVTYEETYFCNEDAGVHSKTARIIETGQEATATVQVDCYER
jgi:hypothetical protein